MEQIYGYLDKEVQTSMAQGRSTKIISMMKWIRTSRLSMKNSLSLKERALHLVVGAQGADLCHGRVPLRLVRPCGQCWVLSGRSVISRFRAKRKRLKLCFNDVYLQAKVSSILHMQY